MCILARMTTGLTAETLSRAIGRLAPHLESVAADLNRADARIGDGDLGITMTKGARELRAVAGELPDDVGAALMTCARAFTRGGGSSYGTLLATGLMTAAKACRGERTVDWTVVSGLLDAAVAAMSDRGGASLGDKTVLDAIDATARALADLDDPAAMTEAALAATDDTLNRFRDRPNRVGRARMFAEKSVGLDDPGMLAFREILCGLR